MKSNKYAHKVDIRLRVIPESIADEFSDTWDHESLCVLT